MCICTRMSVLMVITASWWGHKYCHATKEMQWTAIVRPCESALLSKLSHYVCSGIAMEYTDTLQEVCVEVSLSFSEKTWMKILRGDRLHVWLPRLFTTTRICLSLNLTTSWVQTLVPFVHQVCSIFIVVKVRALWAMLIWVISLVPFIHRCICHLEVSE